MRGVFGQVAHAPLDLLGLLILIHRIQHLLAAALRANIDPLTAGFIHPLDKLRFEQLHPHLAAPGHVDLFDQPLHRPGPAKEIVVGVIHRVDAVILLQPLDLVHNELIAVLPPGALHDHFVVAKAAAEGTAPANINRNGPVIRPRLEHVGVDIGQQIPARRKIIQVLDEGPLRVNYRPARLVLPGQPKHLDPIAISLQLVGELLRGHLPLINHHEVHVIFFEHLFRHDGRVDAPPNGGNTQVMHSPGCLDRRG